MVFNSIGFVIFLTIVFLLYWFVFSKSSKTQNLLLLVASIVFYCIATWKFIFLLTGSGLLNFYIARILAKKEDGSLKKFIFYLGVILNVGILLYFKYFNFFIESFVQLFNLGSGSQLSFTPFHILLPLGISYFTFQMIGYLIDVYNENIEPTNDLLSFATYLAYFPKILSGPIERIQHFLPQIQKKREFNYEMATDGLRQFVWGLFKKMVIANNCATYVNVIFENHQSLPGSVLLLGGILYAINLYADFSGFTDMACGVSKLFNIVIINNFAYPFFTTNISDFWKRWHISLTNWLLDYVYTPLSFILRKYRKYGLIISIFLTFLLVGLWHGANWTFVVYGALHGLYFIPLILRGPIFKNRVVAQGKMLPSFSEFIAMAGLFLLVALTAIIFRAADISEALSYFKNLFSASLFTIPHFSFMQGAGFPIYILLALTLAFFIIEWIGRNHEYPIAAIGTKWKRPYRYAFYYSFIIVIYIFSGAQQQFIYFQF